MKDKSGLQALQSINELEARASQRENILESIRRTLRRSSPANLTGVVDRGTARPVDDQEEQAESLRREEARAEARFKIAVDELLVVHCEILRMSPWGQSLLVPAETALLAANEAFLPWDRALRFGKLVTQELQAVESAGTATEREDAGARAREAMQGFVNGISLLARARPESEMPLLSDLAWRWDGNFEIANAMADVEAQCTAEKAAVAAALAGLEVAYEAIVAAAWSKIPARLHPSAR
jgi:hypothetical protein